MVVREWRARSHIDQEARYPRHFADTVIPRLRAQDGFVSATLLARKLGQHVEFVVMTRWRSRECIVGFAGPCIDQAVVDSDAAAALESFDAQVRHYEVVDEVGGSMSAGFAG